MSTAYRLPPNSSNQVPTGMPPKATRQVSTGIPHYDNVVFPRIENGEKVFNWIAAVFPAFWLPYKGLWTSYAKWVLPTLFVCSFYPKVAFVSWIALMYFVGRDANKLYYEASQSAPNSQGSVGLGVLGLFGGSIASILGGALAAATLMASEVEGESGVEQNRQPQSVSETYSQSSLAILDGQNAVGKLLKFDGRFIGIDSMNGTPYLTVGDVQSNTIWIVTFSTEDRSTVAQLAFGEIYTFICKIRKIGNYENICELQ